MPRLTVTGQALLLAYSIGLVILLLQPFRFALPYFYIINSATWQEGQVVFSAPGLIRSARSAAGLVNRFSKTGAFSIELVVTSFSEEQKGSPSRIVTLSDGKSGYNFIVGQHLKELVILIRTVRNVYPDLVTVARRFPNTDILAPYKDAYLKDLGRDPKKKNHLIIVRDFFFTGMKRHIVVSFDGKILSIFGDGKTYFSGIVRDERFLQNWDKEYSLFLGNEGNGSQPWVGKIDALRFFDRDLITKDIHYIQISDQQKRESKISAAIAGEFRIVGNTPGIWVSEPLQAPAFLEFLIPKMLVYAAKEFLSIPRGEILSFDTFANVLLFVPFGVFIALRKRENTIINFRSAAQVGGLAFLFSFLVEMGQFFIETRDSSLGDVLSNVAGAVIGWIFLVAILRERLSVIS